MIAALNFQARLERQGILRCVDLPERISQQLGARDKLAVRGSVHGVAFQTTLMPRGEGLHRLFVHSRIWKQLELVIGDLLEITIEVDPDPEARVPEALLEALIRHPESAENFQALTAARRREIVRYLESAKTDATRNKRCQEIVTRLVGDLRPRRPPLLD